MNLKTTNTNMSMKRSLLIAAVAVAVCACDKEIDVDAYIPEPGEIQLDMLYPGQDTRVTGNSFDVDDKIGVYVTASDKALQLAGNEVNNEAFAFNGGSWTSSRRVYWNNGTHDIYAYYPYSESVNDVADYSFSVQTDQSNQSAYSQSDFLWASKSGVTASAEPVPMQFEHKMSKVVVNLLKSEGFEGDIPTDAEVYIMNTVPQAVVDLSTGDAAKDNFAATEPIKCLKNGEGVYSAIVVPQSIISRRPLVEVVVGSVSYLMEGKISFRQGYQHTINITLNQSPDKIEISIGGQINSWNN